MFNKIHFYTFSFSYFFLLVKTFNSTYDMILNYCFSKNAPTVIIFFYGEKNN